MKRSRSLVSRGEAAPPSTNWQSVLEEFDASRAAVPLSEELHLLRRERPCPHQGVQPRDGLVAFEVAAQIERGTRSRCDRQARPGELVLRNPFIARHDAARRMSAVENDLDGNVGIDPLRIMQCRGGDPGNDPSSLRPQPGSERAVVQRQCPPFGSMHIREHPSIPACKLVTCDCSGRDGLGADEYFPHGVMLVCATDTSVRPPRDCILAGVYSYFRCWNAISRI